MAITSFRSALVVIRLGTLNALFLVVYPAMDMTLWLPQAEAALAQVEGQ